MVGLDSGRLDRLVRIEAATSTRTSSGSESKTWNELATVWGEKHDLSGREFFAARQISADVTTRFRLRYRADITPSMRLICDGRTFGIESVIETGRRDGLEIMAIERDA